MSAALSGGFNAALLGALFYSIAPKAGVREVPHGDRQALVVTLIPLKEVSPSSDRLGGAKLLSRDRERPDPVPALKQHANISHKLDAVEPRSLPGRQSDEVRAHGAGTSAGFNSPSADTGAVRSDFEQVLRAHVRRYQLYPDAARREGAQGVVRIHFAMDRAGSVLTAWIENSSGSILLDSAALNTIRRAQPLPTIPAGLPAELDVTLPIEFALPRNASFNVPSVASLSAAAGREATESTE